MAPSVTSLVANSRQNPHASVLDAAGLVGDERRGPARAAVARFVAGVLVGVKLWVFHNRTWLPARRGAQGAVAAAIAR
jgi:hypothetical protein